jgi:hypothetical protein
LQDTQQQQATAATPGPLQQIWLMWQLGLAAAAAHNQQQQQVQCQALWLAASRHPTSLCCSPSQLPLLGLQLMLQLQVLQMQLQQQSMTVQMMTAMTSATCVWFAGSARQTCSWCMPAAAMGTW